MSSREIVNLNKDKLFDLCKDILYNNNDIDITIAIDNFYNNSI